METASRLVLSAAVVAITALAAPFAAEVSAEGARIVRVTVYPDRAEVTREAEVHLAAGPAEVVFSGIPFAVEADSLRVSARGVPAVLGAVELRSEARDPAKTPELLIAEAEVRRLEGELVALESEESADKEMMEFLRALRATAGPRSAEQLTQGQLDPEAIKGVYGFVRGQVDELGRRALGRQSKRRELQEQLAVARAKRDAARPAGAIRARSAGVAVEAKQAGPLTVSLTYLTPNAGWRPSYRATLDADKSEIGLAVEAVVRQQTGEDWTDVELKLSTAAPARGVEPPEPTPIVLRPFEPRPLGRQDADGEGNPAVHGAAPLSVRAEKMSVAGVALSPQPAAEAVQAEAEIAQTAYNVAFNAPGRSTALTDGRDHRVVLRTETLPATLGYRAAPGLREEAFVVAEGRAPKDYPLLPGIVRVFSGPAFIGQFGLAETGPGAELKIPFGADRRVPVKRVALPEVRTREGFGGKDVQIAYAFRSTVENLRDREVRVVVVDRMPVSGDERIVIKRGPETTPGFREAADKPGVLEWELTLAPRQKSDIVLEYTVRHPRDLIVRGL